MIVQSIFYKNSSCIYSFTAQLHLLSESSPNSSELTFSHLKSLGFMTILGGIVVYSFAQIRAMLESRLEMIPELFYAADFMKFSIKDFCSKCDKIHSFLRILFGHIYWRNP